jgi:subtilisin-like proprotein convertase family protein
MKKSLILTMMVAALNAGAIIYTTNWNDGFVNGTAIPDNSPSGWSDTRTVSTMPGGTLQGVAVNLQLSSGWVGDLYAYLVSDTGFAVLLDRVGTPGLTYGYGAATWDITLANDGFSGGNYSDIQSYCGGNLSGSTWNPASADLTSFVGGLPNGTWSLFIADLSGGGVTTVQNWGLQMDIVAVPELESWIAAALAGAFGAFWLNRAIWRHATHPPRGELE